MTMVMMYGRTPHQPNHDTFFPPLFLYSTSRTPHKQDKSDLLGGRILPAQLHADDGTDVEVDLVPVQTQIAAKAAHQDHVTGLQTPTREN